MLKPSAEVSLSLFVMFRMRSLILVLVATSNTSKTDKRKHWHYCFVLCNFTHTMGPCLYLVAVIGEVDFVEDLRAVFLDGV